MFHCGHMSQRKKKKKKAGERQPVVESSRLSNIDPKSASFSRMIYFTYDCQLFWESIDCFNLCNFLYKLKYLTNLSADSSLLNVRICCLSLYNWQKKWCEDVTAQTTHIWPPFKFTYKWGNTCNIRVTEWFKNTPQCHLLSYTKTNDSYFCPYIIS